MKAALPFLSIMEILKLQLIASYLFLILGRPLPFLPASFVFLAAVGLSIFLRAGGGRVIFYVLSHALGLAASFLALYSAFRNIPLRLGGLLPQNNRDLLEFSFIAFSTAAFWIRGARLGWKTPDHPQCVGRFDEGLGVFLFAFCLATLMQLENPLAKTLIIPFFLFAILALGISRSENAKRGGLARRPRRTMLIPIAAAFVLTAAGVALLVPMLFSPAERAGTALKDAVIAAEPYIGAFLRWLFGFNRSSAAPAASTDSGSGFEAPPAGEESPLARLIALIVMWSLGALLALILIVLVAYGLAKLFAYLASRVEKRGPGVNLAFLPAWLRAFILGGARFFARCRAIVGAAFARKKKHHSAAVEAYARLLVCGRIAGKRRKPNETPREYARRLTEVFPRSARKAEFVVEALEKEAYGLRAPIAAVEPILALISRKTRAWSFLAERVKNFLTSGRKGTGQTGK
ncbi:MAG: DUF4129 domain-containing protein [Treponemataceae bacterium]